MVENSIIKYSCGLDCLKNDDRRTFDELTCD